MRKLFFGVALLCGVPDAVLGQTEPPIPELRRVPAGEFLMGWDEGAAWERPAHRVRAPAFRIGARPVTNAEFRGFRPDHESPGDDAPQAPVTGVSWLEAEQYCRWLSERLGRSFFLPPEAWWERAARGGLEGKRYPWGDEPAPAGDAAVPPNDFDVYAVGYNLWEWTADWYAPDYYEHSGTEDPRGPAEGIYRVLRGGGYRDDPASAGCHTRGSARPTAKSEVITFRVATAADAGPTRVTEAPTPPKPKPAASTPPPAPAAAAAPAPTEQSDAPAVISAVVFERDAGAGLIHLAVDRVPRYRVSRLENPDRLVVDLPEARLDTGALVGRAAGGAGGVEQVRYSQFSLEPPSVRVVIDLETPVEHEFIESPNRLTIRIRPKP